MIKVKGIVLIKVESSDNNCKGCFYWNPTGKPTLTWCDNKDENFECVKDGKFYHYKEVSK